MDLVKLVYRQHRKHDADVKIVIHITRINKVHVNCELKKPECDKIVGHIWNLTFLWKWCKMLGPS